MSRESLETIHQANAAWNRGDFGTLADFFDPAVEWRDLAHAPDTPETVAGIGAVMSIWEEWAGTFDELRAEVSEYIDAGDSVVCVTRWYGRGKASGLVIDQSQADVFELRQGKIVRVTLAYPDKAAALEAVG
jgi:ketosteroid isomerase-like protein